MMRSLSVVRATHVIGGAATVTFDHVQTPFSPAGSCYSMQLTRVLSGDQRFSSLSPHLAGLAPGVVARYVAWLRVSCDVRMRRGQLTFGISGLPDAGSGPSSATILPMTRALLGFNTHRPEDRCARVAVCHAHGWQLVSISADRRSMQPWEPHHLCVLLCRVSIPACTEADARAYRRSPWTSTRSGMSPPVTNDRYSPEGGRVVCGRHALLLWLPVVLSPPLDNGRPAGLCCSRDDCHQSPSDLPRPSGPRCYSHARPCALHSVDESGGDDLDVGRAMVAVL